MLRHSQHDSFLYFRIFPQGQHCRCDLQWISSADLQVKVPQRWTLRQSASQVCVSTSKFAKIPFNFLRCFMLLQCWRYQALIAEKQRSVNRRLDSPTEDTVCSFLSKISRKNHRPAWLIGRGCAVRRHLMLPRCISGYWSSLFPSSFPSKPFDPPKCKSRQVRL